MLMFENYSITPTYISYRIFYFAGLTSNHDDKEQTTRKCRYNKISNKVNCIALFSAKPLSLDFIRILE